LVSTFKEYKQHNLFAHVDVIVILFFMATGSNNVLMTIKQ